MSQLIPIKELKSQADYVKCKMNTGKIRLLYTPSCLFNKPSHADYFCEFNTEVEADNFIKNLFNTKLDKS